MNASEQEVNSMTQQTYTPGDVVEVVDNPMFVERLGKAPVWVQTKVEPFPQALRDKGFTESNDKVYVRIDGMLVSRSPKYVRRAS